MPSIRLAIYGALLGLLTGCSIIAAVLLSWQDRPLQGNALLAWGITTTFTMIACTSIGALIYGDIHHEE